MLSGKTRTHFLVFLSIALLFGGARTAGAQASSDAKEKRKELSKLKVELDRAESELDSLRGVEAGLLKRLSTLDERLALDREVIKKVTARLKRLRQKKNAAESTLTERKARLAEAKERYSHQALDVYLNTFAHTQAPAPGGVLPEVPAPEFRDVYFASLNEQTRRRIRQAEDSAASAEKRLKAVARSEREAENLRKKRTVGASIRQSQLQSSKRSLAKVRKSKESVADRLLFLSEAARQMSELVARLEARERERGTGGRFRSQNTGLFVAQKGRMKPPIAGRIVSAYGWKTDDVTNLKSYSPGVEIKGKPNYNVRAVAEGVVVYVGSLRSYGNFVIVAHDDGYYSTYGGLDRVKVRQDQRIPAREPVGVTADGMVKFELRKGQEPVDPVQWLDFGQLR